MSIGSLSIAEMLSLLELDGILGYYEGFFIKTGGPFSIKTSVLDSFVDLIKGEPKSVLDSLFLLGL